MTTLQKRPPEAASQNPEAADLYAELGVSREASTDDIRRAYRQRAKETHPDLVKGREEEFKRVQRAHDILTDAEARAKYDKTGRIPSDDDIASIREKAMALISNLFAQAIQAVVRDAENRTDLVKLMRKELEQQQRAIIQNQMEYRSVLQRLKDAAKRVSKKKRKGETESDNILKRMLEHEIEKVQNDLISMDTHLAITRQAESILANYSYKVDAAPVDPFRTFTASPFVFGPGAAAFFRDSNGNGL